MREKDFMKKLLWFFITGSFAVGMFFVTDCIADELEIIPNVGYSNIQRKDAWNVVGVTVQNRAGPINGTIEISAGSMGQNIISRDIKIGKGRFLYQLYYYCDDPWEVKVTLRKGKRLAAKPTVLAPAYLDPGTYMCLVVGKMPGIARLKKDTDRDFHVAYISDPREMPDLWLGYDLADFLIFSNSDLSRLKEDQQEAVLDWITRGGKIGIAAGKDWQYIRDSFLEEIMPIDIIGTKEVPSSEVFRALSMAGGRTEETITIADVENYPEDSVLYSVREEPLVTKFKYGRGEILFFAMDPGSEVFRNSQNIESFWKLVLGIKKEKRSDISGSYDYTIHRWLEGIPRNLSTISGVRQISLGALMLIFLIYLAVIGPIDYFLLKKLRRLSWTHLTFVIYVLIFSAFAYIYTYRMKGGDMWIRKCIIADLHSDSGEATGTTAMMVFSPQNNTYVFPVNNTTALRPTEFDVYGYLGYGGVNTRKKRRFSVSDSGNELHIPIPIWSSQFLKADWILPSPGELKCSLKMRGTRITGEIENNLDMDIEGITLLYNDRMVLISGIAKGQKKIINNELRTRIADNLDDYNFDNLDNSVLFMTVPEIWAESQISADSVEDYISRYSELKKSSMAAQLKEEGKGILIIKCSRFDDGIGIKGWESANKESYVYFRKVFNVEN